MNRTQLIAAVRYRTGYRADDPYVDEAVGAAIEAAVRKIEQALETSQFHYPWLEKAVEEAVLAGDASIALPADFRRDLYATWVPDTGARVKLARASAADLDEMAEPAGTPSHFCVFGANVLIAPIPDAPGTLVFRYTCEEPALDGASDEPLLPARYHDAIVELAASDLYRRDHRPAEADQATQLATGIIGKAMQERLLPRAATRAISDVLNAGDLINMVRNSVGNEADAPELSNDAILGFLNDGLHALEDAHDWLYLRAEPDTITLAAGDTSFPLPAGWRRTLTVGAKDAYRELDEVSPADITSLDSREGTPEVFAVIDGAIHIRPIPTKQVTLVHHWSRNEEPMVALDDEPLLARKWRRALVEFAVFCITRRNPALPGAQIAKGEFDRIVATMVQADRNSSGLWRRTRRLRANSPFRGV